MKLYTDLNLMRIVMELFDADLYRLKNNEYYQIDDITYQELKMAALNRDIKYLLVVIKRMFEQSASDGKPEQVMFLSFFLYRYIYFYRTLTDWEEFASDEPEVQMIVPGEFFLAHIAPFFEKQITFFLANYERFLTELHVKAMSQTLVSEIEDLISNIRAVDEFDARLIHVEDLIKYFQNARHLLSFLEGIESKDKETFLTLTNEIKVDLQSMNNLISVILKKLQAMKVE